MFDIYECNKDDTARFLLGTNGERKLIVVGLNPSTATREKSDRTVTMAKTIAQKAGYSGFVMTNLYPLRSTDPKKLTPSKDKDTELFNENIKHIKFIALAEEYPTFWAAWGENILSRTYLKEAMCQIKDLAQSVNGKWVQFGDLTQKGHPRHPSRQSYKSQFRKFDITQYKTIIF